MWITQHENTKSKGYFALKNWYFQYKISCLNLRRVCKWSITGYFISKDIFLVLWVVRIKLHLRYVQQFSLKIHSDRKHGSIFTQMLVSFLLKPQIFRFAFANLLKSDDLPQVTCFVSLFCHTFFVLFLSKTIKLNLLVLLLSLSLLIFTMDNR